MLRGTLSSPPFPRLHLYTDPVNVLLRYYDIDKDPFETPQEAQVWFQLGEESKDAFVPLHIVDEDQQTVVATLIGERGDKIVVSFPVTNFGRTRFAAYEQDLAEIAVDYPQGG